MKRLGTILALVFVVTTTGCGPDTTGAPERSREGGVQTVDPATATKLKLGDSLHVIADLPNELGGDRVYFMSFASRDKVLGAVIPDDTDPARQSRLAQSRPVMYDLESKQFTVLHDGDRSEPTWVADVVGNDDVVAWVEGTDYNIAHNIFTICAYDRATEKVTAIGEYDDPKGQVAYQNDLAVAHRTAYFSTAALGSRKGAVYAIPVDGSAPPKVLVPGGDQVRIDGDTLRYWVRNPDDKTEYPKHFTYDLKTEVTTAVPVSAHAREDGFCGAEVTEAWTTSCTGHTLRAGPARDHNQPLLTITEASGRTTKFKPFPVGSLNSPIPHDVISLGRWTGISVPTDDGQEREFLVDLDTKEIQVFPDNTSFGPMSPDRATVLVSSFGKRHGRQRVVRIPAS